MQNNIYDERCHIMKCWFTNWTDPQRRLFLKELCDILTPNQKHYVTTVLRLPSNDDNKDFSHHIPHSIAVLIFSYLDPRSLCRSAQVCWYWKCLTESNEIWISKCLKLGWCLPLNDTQSLQPNAWKQLFKQNFLRLKHISQPVIKYTLPTTEIATMTENTPEATFPSFLIQNEGKIRPKSVLLRPTSGSVQETLMSNYNSRPSSGNSFVEPKFPSHIMQLGKRHPPWRGSSRKPQDLIRYNYLDNKNIIWELTQERERIFGKYMD